MGGLHGVAKVNEAIARQVLKRDARTAYTPSSIPRLSRWETRDAAMTYLEVKGSRPIVATLKKHGLVLASDCKASNDIRKAYGLRNSQSL